jgi:hypothetical protein
MLSNIHMYKKNAGQIIILLLSSPPMHSPISYFRQGPQVTFCFDNFISSGVILPYSIISYTAVAKW